MSDRIAGCDDIKYVSDELLTAKYFSTSETPVSPSVGSNVSTWHITALHCFYENGNYDVLG